MRRLAFVLPILSLLAACAGEDKISRYQPVGYLPDAEQLSNSVDWSAPDVIEMQMVNHAFVPDEITVRRNRPTKLILRNPSKSDHTFVAEQFFKSIAVRQLVGRDITATTPWVEKVVVPAGETKELWFVPARYGAFTFECTVPGHALLGMKGVVHVSN